MAAFLVATAGAGCDRVEPDEARLAPGVFFRRERAAGAQVVDVDLSRAPVRATVVAEGVEPVRNNLVGDCRTVPEWAERRGAVAGLNGGFFGHTYDDRGRRKQIMGLAVSGGNVVAPGGIVHSRTTPGERFLRAAIGFRADGTPDIAWAAGARGGRLLRYGEPVNPGNGAPWRVTSAVACGPRLFVRGERRITDREERLASNRELPRAFAAYDLVNGKPDHFVIGRADDMEFEQVADFLAAYFRRRHGTAPYDALCLDGGPSAQLVYRDEAGTLHDAEPTGVLVPTVLLLLPKEKPTP
jgi:hypothetical protein